MVVQDTTARKRRPIPDPRQNKVVRYGMNAKLNPIERALVAAAGMAAPDSRSVLMMICASGMTTAKTVEQPTPGQLHYSKREKIIKRTKGACDRIIDYAKHETLRNVEKHFRETAVVSAEGDPKTLAVKLAFKKARFSEEMIAALREEATIALGIAGQQLFDEIGSDSVWKTPAADALAYLDSRENLFANASDEIHSDVMEQLQTGLDHGETKKELMARIGAAFDGIKQTRADTIANTETAAAFNFSRDKAMREAGVTHKKWLHSQRPEQEPRPTHVENTGQTVPIDEPFDISGVKFMYPSDDSLGAGPEDIINCHCVAIPTEAP
jgi:hypothetical protein